MRIVSGWLGALMAVSVQAAPCVAQSGAGTAALVELYASASDRNLPGLGQDHGSERVVRVALHIRYGDYTGSMPSQRRLTPLQRLALAHTPLVLLQGREFRGDSGAFNAALAMINAQPSRVRLRLEIAALTGKQVTVRALAELQYAARQEPAALYLAAFEARGDAALILEWTGPYAFPGPRLAEERVLPLLPDARPDASGVVGFVQNRRSGEVLQAVLAPACPGSFGYIRAKQASAA